MYSSILHSFVAVSLLVSNTASAQIDLMGKMEQGALIRAHVESGTRAFLNGAAIKVSPKGYLAFGFSRDAVLTQELKLVYPDGLTQVMPLILSPKEYKIDKVNGISKKIMTPDPKDITRSRKDSQQVKAARAHFSEQTAFSQTFIWPLTGRISGVYGSQRVYNGTPGNPHYGVDVAAKTGTPVVAPANGVISLSVADMFYSGGTIILDHGYGVSSSFLHLSKLYVKEGDVIKQGQPIAEVGATGRVTGPHLDWRINWYQMRLDPVTIVPSMADALKKSPAN
ncbi:M23 family metallopeptidase [Shewanella sp. VB17]|nr:M23 family metallopeptidase [Shewanella sp. VB17]NRD74305.1 M23 family metallopeptidase [Shewanella sp. VB17]